MRSRRPSRGWLFGPLLSLVFLIFPLQVVLDEKHPLALLLLALGGTMLFVSGFLWLMWFHRPFLTTPTDGAEVQKRRTVVVLLALIVITLNFVFGFEWRGLLFHTNVVAGLMLVRRDAYLAVAGLAIATLGLGITSGEAWFVLPTAALGLWATAFASQLATVAELQAARQELARRAVWEERLRFARDLHDLLGHSLSLITLKSELAGRLLPINPERAAKEIGEAEQVARRALREVREAVAGYRQPTLADELYTAEEILRAAEIHCQIKSRIHDVTPRVEALLAWTIREGVTNVVRHSRAHHCIIQLTEQENRVFVEIRDDGRGLLPAENQADHRSGSGLAGLAERVATVPGATMVAEALPTAGFQLRVTIPCQQRAEKDEDS